MSSKQSSRKKPARKYNFKVIDVKGDGNCFFRAIYKSAKHSGNLENLVKCFLDKPVSAYINAERTFIMDMREKLAKSIEDGKDGGQVSSIYSHLSGFDVSDEESMETYTLIVESLPAWISTRFEKPPKSLAEFRSAVCENIRKQGTYVSQIEIDIYKYLNDTYCNTPEKQTILSIFASPPKVDIDITHINILNVANIHYKYLRSYESVDNESASKTSSSFSKSSDSPFEFLDSSTSSSNDSSTSSETRELMKGFKTFMLKEKITKKEKPEKKEEPITTRGKTRSATRKNLTVYPRVENKKTTHPPEIDDTHPEWEEKLRENPMVRFK
jgi:hypothetical protein